jgi:hypothetical protein
MPENAHIIEYPEKYPSKTFHKSFLIDVPSLRRYINDTCKKKLSYQSKQKYFYSEK